jgi:hypothetical protein
MLKKTFIGVLFVVFVSGLLIAGINFNVTKATDYGSSGTSVGGIIWENTTWTLENSPYLFVDYVTVAKNTTLTIEPGVIVNFDIWSLIVEGTLVAKGNESNRIILQSEEEPLPDHPPSRVYFKESSTAWNELAQTGCIIEYAEINCSAGHYDAIGGGAPKISKNIILNGGIASASYYAIFVEGGIISNNTILGGYEGVCIKTGIVSNNTFIDVHYAIHTLRGVVSNNVIQGSQAGIFSANGSIINNIIKDSWTALYLSSGETPAPIYHPVAIGNLMVNCSEGIDVWGTVRPLIANNTIVRCAISGISFSNNAFYEGSMPAGIIYNNIHSNGYNVKVYKEDPRITINMTYNWWGVTNTSFIDQKIYDQNDNGRLCLVNYTPFLTSPAISIDSTPPITFDDYDGLWHNTDYFINLNATDDLSSIAEIYYRINEEPTKNLSVAGQPYITTEGANNTLEYWSVDNAGNEEVPHKILTGIKLDKTVPTIGTPSRIPEGDVEPDQKVKVLVNVTDSLSGIKNVTLSYNLNNSAIWIDLPMILNSTTTLYEVAIPRQEAGTLVKYKTAAYDNAGNYKVEDNSGQYYIYTVIPEFPSNAFLVMFMILVSLAITLLKKFKFSKGRIS